MRVVLVHPDIVDVSQKYQINTLSKYPAVMPLGILYIAAVLEEKGHEVKAYDNALSEIPNPALARMILDCQPDVVGFSVTFKNIGNARIIAKLIKKQNRNIKIIFGGPQVCYIPQEVIVLPYVDIVTIGEGEALLLSILNQGFRDLENIPNIYFKDRSGKVISTGRKPVPADLDRLPYPARHLLDANEYKRKWPEVPTFTMITSRGCPYRCTFCSLPPQEKKYRTRDPFKVVDEIEHLIKTYDARTIAFMEDNFALDKKHVIKICEEIIKRKIKIRWSCETRVNNVTRDLLARMKEAGLWNIFLGVESGSQNILDLLKKDITIEEIKTAFAWCKELGIETFASFMLGIPGETRNDVFDSFDFMSSLQPSQFSFQTYVGIPGSELYEFMKSNKLYSAAWESVLFVSTKQLPRKEIIKLEKEIGFRSGVYKLLRTLKLELPPKDHETHYNKPWLKNIVQELTETLPLVKQDPEKGIKMLQKLILCFNKIKKTDVFTKRILIYCYLLLGLIYNIGGEKEKARLEINRALALDNKIKIPYQI